MPRVAVIADLHHDVPRSRAPAEALAATWPTTEADALLVVGDAATADDANLERCLSLFADDGRPRLFVPGNHELWTKRAPVPARALLGHDLPRRVRAAGWHWLPGRPFVFDDGTAAVGTGGWYDHAFADERLGLPRRFYQLGVSPAAAPEHLRPDDEDVPAHSRSFAARWNDRRFARDLGDDAAFCEERCAEFAADLDAVADCGPTLAAVHVCPDARLLPRPPEGPVPHGALKYAFARAYLGSPCFGELALARANVAAIACGHSHVRREVCDGGVRLLNVGSTYTEKRVDVIDL